MIREIARDKSKTQQLLSSVIGLKLILAVVSFTGIVIAGRLLDYPALTQQLLLLAGLYMIIESFSVTLYGVFRGHQNFKYEAIGTIIHQFVVMSIGIAGLLIYRDLMVLGFAIVAGALANFLFAAWNIVRKLGQSLVPKLSKPTLKIIIRLAVPFFIAGVFTKIYAYIDIVLLRNLTDAGHVGWYSVAYKLTYAIQFLPIAISNSVFPAFSQLFVYSKERLQKLLEQSFFFMISISIPIAVGIFFLADLLITNPNLWPTYEESIPALRISIISLPFIFINLVASTLLGACNRQKINTINIGITSAVNIVANLILIPIYAHVGASISALFSSLVLFLLSVYWARKTVTFRIGWLLGKALRSLAASVIMLTVLYFIGSKLSIFILIPIAALTYAFSFWLVKGVNKEDISLIRNVISRRKPVDEK